MDALEAGIVLITGGQLVPEGGLLADLGADALAQISIELFAALNAVTTPVDLFLMLHDEQVLEEALDAGAGGFLRLFDVVGHGTGGRVRF